MGILGGGLAGLAFYFRNRTPDMAFLLGAFGASSALGLVMTRQWWLSCILALSFGSLAFPMGKLLFYTSQWTWRWVFLEYFPGELLHPWPALVSALFTGLLVILHYVRLRSRGIWPRGGFIYGGPPVLLWCISVVADGKFNGEVLLILALFFLGQGTALEVALRLSRRADAA